LPAGFVRRLDLGVGSGAVAVAADDSADGEKHMWGG
jgi:hypothetical protein